MRTHAIAVLLMAVAWTTAGSASATVLLTADEALALAFPDAVVVKQTLFLEDAEVERAQQLAGVDCPSALVTAYRAERDGKFLGTAYFDAHVVRTLPEVLMVVIDPDGEVARLEVLSFQEPTEYLPKPRWYAQLLGHGLTDELALDRAVRPVVGATLTARATLAAARRVLAIHRVIGERSAAGDDASGEPAPTPVAPASGATRDDAVADEDRAPAGVR